MTDHILGLAHFQTTWNMSWRMLMQSKMGYTHLGAAKIPSTGSRAVELFALVLKDLNSWCRAARPLLDEFYWNVSEPGGLSGYTAFLNWALLKATYFSLSSKCGWKHQRSQGNLIATWYMLKFCETNPHNKTNPNLGWNMLRAPHLLTDLLVLLQA